MVEKRIGYHVTDRKHLPSIQQQGLIPKVPQDYGESGDTKGVYFFKTEDDTATALASWLGERIEEWEEETGETYDEIVLVVDLTGLDDSTIEEDDMFEYIVVDIVDPSRILDILKI